MLPRGWLVALLAVSGLSAGCARHLTTMALVAPEVREACQEIALDSRAHVYIFCIQGLDPVDYASLEGLKETLQFLGFPKTWYATSCRLRTLKKEIACILHDDPKARFVLVGYGHGVSAATELARAVGTQGVEFDLLVCLGEDTPCPSSIHRKITLLNCKHSADGDDVLILPVKKSSDIPLHPETVEILVSELTSLAGSIPAEADLPQMYYPEHEPRPRPVMPPASDAEAPGRDRWDFLKPAPVDDRESLPPGTLPAPRQQEQNPAREVLRQLPRKSQ